MTLVDLRKTITDTIGTWFPKADCETHPGRFNVAEIKRLAVKTPAIRVACLGLPAGQAVGDGEVDRDVAFAAFVITTDKAQLPRDTAAINMVEDLLLRLPGQRWATAVVHGVDEAKIKAENLYSSSVDNGGMSLWAVAWTQKVRMGTNAYPQGPILSEEAYAGGEA